MEERRPPSVPVVRQGEVVAVALHPDDDQAEADPRVEPSAKLTQIPQFEGVRIVVSGT